MIYVYYWIMCTDKEDDVLKKCFCFVWEFSVRLVILLICFFSWNQEGKQHIKGNLKMLKYYDENKPLKSVQSHKIRWSNSKLPPAQTKEKNIL